MGDCNLLSLSLSHSLSFSLYLSLSLSPPLFLQKFLITLKKADIVFFFIFYSEAVFLVMCDPSMNEL
jgi:hypothetical protein